MPDPTHRPLFEQSDELKAILDAQKPAPRWLARPSVRRRVSDYLLAVTLGALLALSVRSCLATPLDLDRLLPALVKVESSGNPAAVGDRGKALGCLQIWEVVIKDVNRAHGTHYTHRDAFDPAKARDICRRYLAIYCTPSRLGRTPTMEDAARIWNGGPTGYRKPQTEKYWHKVAAVL